jgi:dTDP-4-dehydrorhamnose reductase
MKKILITGANGLLGQALQRLFQKKYQILSTGIEDSAVLKTAANDYQILDITDLANCKAMINVFKPDVIVNAASYTNVDECENKKELCWQINVKGVENLANLARRHDIQLIHYSTDYVFNGKNGPYKEEERPHPLGYYGKSKLASENVLRQIGCPFSILRTCVLFGTGTAVKKNFFLWVLESLQNEKSILVVTDQYNNPTLAEDLAAGSELVIKKAAVGLYHLEGKEYLNRFDFASAIAKIFDLNSELIKPIKSTHLKQLAARPQLGGLEIEMAKENLAYNPKSLTESLLYLKQKITHDE